MARSDRRRCRPSCCCRRSLAAPLAEAEADDLARVFAALADPVRLRLLSLVAAAGEVCSCDLAGAARQVPADRRHHTKALAEAGLIVGEKRGRWVWWRIVPERLAAVRGALGARARSASQPDGWSGSADDTASAAPVNGARTTLISGVTDT